MVSSFGQGQGYTAAVTALLDVSAHPERRDFPGLLFEALSANTEFADDTADV